MKATGIVRRIDDLGRVVIPKEIRRQLRIKEGDPLELYVTNSNEVIFKKYSPMACQLEAEPLAEMAKSLCKALGDDFQILVIDTMSILAQYGIGSRTVGATIGESVTELMAEKKDFMNFKFDLVNVPFNRECSLMKVLYNNDTVPCGAIAVFGKQVGESEKRLIDLTANLIQNFFN